MFDTPNRRHPVQTFQFWFVVLTCFVAVTAWKLDLFSFPAASLPVVTDEPMPPPPLVREEGEINQPTSAPEQSESLVDSSIPPSAQPLEQLPEIPRQLANKLVDVTHLEVEETAETEEASVVSSPIVRTANAVLQETRPQVMQAVSEQPSAALESHAEISPAAPINFPEVDQLISEGGDVRAHRLLSNCYWQHPEQRPQLMERLHLLSRRIYFLPDPHYLAPYTVQFGDRLETVARKYQVSQEYLAKMNRIDPQALRPNQQLKVIQGPFSGVIDISDFELTVHAQGYFLASFPVGFGTDCSVPEGAFQVTDKVVNPDYYGPQGVLTHQDPSNPLGSRWLTINNAQRTLQGYGIHSTNNSQTVGKIESQGCIRLKPQDAETVFDLLTVGSELIIHP